MAMLQLALRNHCARRKLAFVNFHVKLLVEVKEDREYDWRNAQGAPPAIAMMKNARSKPTIIFVVIDAIVPKAAVVLAHSLPWQQMMHGSHRCAPIVLPDDAVAHAHALPVCVHFHR